MNKPILLIVLLIVSSALPLSLFPAASAATPGDSFDTASQITVGRYSDTLTSGDHFYKVEVRAGQTLTLRLDVPEGSAHNLLLYDPDRNVLASSERSGSLDEEIQRKIDATGTYFIKITGTRFSGTGTYRLTVLITEFTIVDVAWGSSVPRPEAGPGDVGVPLQITLRNGGDYSAEALVATLNLPDAFSNSTGGRSVTTHLTTPVPSGQTGLFTFAVNIAGDASIGGHGLTLTLNHKIRTSSDLIEGSPEELAATVFLLGKVNLAASTETQRLIPGETSSIDVRFRNTGTATATGVEVILTSPSALTLVGAENRLYFGQIAPNETVETSIPVQVSSASAGSLVQLGLSISYTDAYGASRSASRSLGFEIVAERVLFQVAGVSWSAGGRQLEVGPGDEGVTLNVEVQNLGENSVTGLRGTLYLTAPFNRMLEGNVVSSAYGVAVQPGQFGVFDFVFDVDPQAAVGLYHLDLEMGYLLLKEGQPQKAEPVNLTVPVLLLGKADIAVSTSVVVLKPDDSNPLSLSIMNRGSGEASAVDASITIPTNVVLSGVDNHIFTQNLQAGSSYQSDVSIFVPLQAAGSTIQLTFTISYRDPYGEGRSTTRTLTLRVLEIEGAEISIVDAVWGSPDSPIKVNLGDRNVPAMLVVKNTGTKPVTGLSAEIRLPPPLTNSTGGDTATAYFGGVIQPGGVAQLPFKVDLDENGATGLARLGVSVDYLIVRGELHQPARQDDLSASLLLRERTAVEISVEGSVLTAETINDATVTVTNTGSARLEEITLTITPPNTVSLTSGSNQVELRDLRLDESREIRLGLFAPASAVGLPLQGQLAWTYKDSYGLSQSGSKAFGLIVQAWSSPISVSTEANILRVGMVSESEIEIRNVGESPIYSLQVALDLPSAAGPSPLVLISGSNRWFFDSVSAGGGISFNPMIIAAFSSVDSSYQAQLSISYRDRYGVSHSETRSIGFTARGLAVMTILSQSSSAALSGSAIQITGSLLNKGTASAYYTTLMVKPTPDVRPALGDPVYLGEISTNTPFPFSVSVAVSRNTSNGTYPVTLVFGYEDEYGSQYTFEHEAQITVGGPGAGPPTPPSSPRQPSGFTGGAGGLLGFVETYWLYITLGAVVLLLLLGVVRRRRLRDRVRRRIAAAGEQGEK